MSASPRQILGVGPGADARALKRAYRKLAMRWHPDRNDDPSATARFQEIQSAYRRALADLDPETVRARSERTAADMARREEWERKRRSEREERDGPFAERVGMGAWEQIPLAALAILALGFWALAQLPGVVGWGAFSAAVMAAGAAYKSGVSAFALRAEFLFRAALKTYFFALLAWAVWTMARKNWEALALTL